MIRGNGIRVLYVRDVIVGYWLSVVIGMLCSALLWFGFGLVDFRRVAGAPSLWEPFPKRASAGVAVPSPNSATAPVCPCRWVA